MSVFKDFFYLFYPKTCEACGNVLLKNENFLCTKCLSELPYTNYHKIPDNTIEKLFWGRVFIYSATALFKFHKKSRYQKLIHKLKYKGKKEIGFFLGQLFAYEIKNHPKYNDIDFIVPVPLHPKRYKERGYNQAEWIAMGIADVLKTKISANNLYRKVATQTQTKKSRLERWKNVNSIFDLKNYEQFKNKHILLVDDVITTGSTLESCAETLLKTGNIKISIGTIAVA